MLERHTGPVSVVNSDLRVQRIPIELERGSDVGGRLLRRHQCVGRKDQVCAARTQLETSVTALTSSSLLADGTTAIKSAVDQVQTDLNTLSAAAKDDYRPQVDAVQVDLQRLQTTVSNLGDGNLAENLTALVRRSPPWAPPQRTCSRSSRQPAVPDARLRNHDHVGTFGLHQQAVVAHTDPGDDLPER